ncbi:MAG: hypothetical protein FJ294_10295 [Planctomycetes bacterium]|nr:hypothetical protein [Planctomycetota bacterium]
MIAPCPYCGYDWPVSANEACATCAGRPPQSLRGRRGGWGELQDGLAALLQGARLLVTTRGTKRWIVPPAVCTFAAFTALSVWLYRTVMHWLERGRELALEQLPELDGWERALAEWLVDHALSLAAAKASAFLIATSLTLLVSLWAFSLLYELLAGPFLDELQGVLESRWFGADPRAARERPVGLTGVECALGTLACVGVIAAGVTLGLWVARPGSLLYGALAGLAACAAILFCWPPFRRWLLWRARIELRTVLASVQATALSGLLLVFALPVLLVPLVGHPLFALAAGFTTALSLLDIPMSRRRWSIGTRWRFLSRHPLALVAFGATAALGYLLPVLGPLVVVPCASAGGLWLLLRIDKSALRQAP